MLFIFSKNLIEMAKEIKRMFDNGKLYISLSSLYDYFRKKELITQNFKSYKHIAKGENSAEKRALEILLESRFFEVINFYIAARTRFLHETDLDAKKYVEYELTGWYADTENNSKLLSNDEKQVRDNFAIQNLAEGDIYIAVDELKELDYFRALSEKDYDENEQVIDFSKLISDYAERIEKKIKADETIIELEEQLKIAEIQIRQLEKELEKVREELAKGDVKKGSRIKTEGQGDSRLILGALLTYFETNPPSPDYSQDKIGIEIEKEYKFELRGLSDSTIDKKFAESKQYFLNKIEERKKREDQKNSIKTKK